MSRDILQLSPPPGGRRIIYGDDPLQFAELRLPVGSGPFPVAIVIHGGFWRAAYNLDHTSHLCVALNDSGMATWSLEYRRIGNPGGAYPGTFNDIEAGTSRLKTAGMEHPLDLDRAVIVGHSAGGQLALWVASHRVLRLRGVVSLAGVSDLRRAYELKLSNSVVEDLLGGSPEQVPDRYERFSPIRLLPLGIPQRLIHGALDPHVPFEMSAAYVAAAKAKGDDAELIPLDNAGHFELIDPRATEFETVRKTIKSLLRPA
jgi:dipeptidyl aminopeptidase/acylaminoacyl peptidase